MYEIIDGDFKQSIHIDKYKYQKYYSVDCFNIHEHVYLYRSVGNTESVGISCNIVKDKHRSQMKNRPISPIGKISNAFRIRIAGNYQRLARKTDRKSNVVRI